MRTLRSITAAAVMVLATFGARGADQAFSAANPFKTGGGGPQALRALPIEAVRRIELAPPDPADIDALRRANSAVTEKRLQIGVGRSLAGYAGARDGELAWQRVAAGFAAQWQVTSRGAAALRIGLEINALPAAAQLRFSGSGAPGIAYGPFTAAEASAVRPLYWSPVLEGERATVEIFVPDGASPSSTSLAIAQVSHLFASPSAPTLDVYEKAGSGPCEVDIICLSASNSALASTGRSVARMTFTMPGGGTSLCTGTLLATSAGPGEPYFYSANHCIGTQSVASTLTTHWFYDSAGCGNDTLTAAYVQLAGGATLLYANAGTDVLLLRLNATPPAGAVYAGWNSTALADGTALTAIHHPAGDLKKVSLGSAGGFSAYGGGIGTSHIIALWDSLATGVTEGGSSGSAIFTAVGNPATSYQLRGGLHGGPSSCSATGAALRDYYSRFDQAYPFLAQYLSPSGQCTYSISPQDTSIGAAAANGSFSVTAASGCAWSATSNDSFVTTTSAGSGNGSVSFTVAANVGVARTGTISVGGQTFTITQAAGQGAVVPLIANGGFESGATAWTQSSTGNYAIITGEPEFAHAGMYDAWLGGYFSGTDVLSQDFTIPADADYVRLDYWYWILSEESGSAFNDTMTVTLHSASTGEPLTTIATYGNPNSSADWIHSPVFDLTAFRGQTVRLAFTAVGNSSLYTSFRIDDVSLDAVYFGGIQSADIALSQSVAPAVAAAGKDVIVSLLATNNGPAQASGVSVAYPLPAGTQYIWSSPGCTLASTTVTCVEPAMPAVTSRTFKVVVRPASAGAFDSNASVTTLMTNDPAGGNDSVSTSVTVAATPAGMPVLRYRLYSPVTLEHHFTTDLNEYNVLGGFVGTWVQEGTVGRVLDNPGSFAGVEAVPYYRLYDTSTRWHHWTTDANEYYTLAEFPWWNAEGVDGYILGSNPAGTTQLYRLLYPFVAGLHHWTIDANEYNTLIDTYGWIGEGGSGFVVSP